MTNREGEPTSGPRRVGRRFGLADAMILVAAAAVGVELTRPLIVQLDSEFSRLTQGLTPVMKSIQRFAVGATAAYPTVTTLSAALIVIRLKSPRPPLGRLARQPGVVACVAIMAPLLVTLLGGLPHAIRQHGSPPSLPGLTFMLWVQAIEVCGHAVIGAWAVLFLLGGWRPERSWIDRFGRALGCAWIAPLAFGVVMSWIHLGGW